MKRTERVGALIRILTESPNKIYSLQYFCDLFDAAKSSISEDIQSASQAIELTGSGCLETGELTISLHERIDCYYPGTGDVFAAVMLGALLGGAKLRDACVKAGEFVRDTIAYTAQQGTDPNFGVQFEKLLPYLWQK